MRITKAGLRKLFDEHIAIQQLDRRGVERVHLRGDNAFLAGGTTTATQLRAEWLAVGLFQGLFLFEVVGIVAVLWFGGRWALAGTLTLGTLIMFGPVLWLVLSSFKSQQQLIRFPPTNEATAFVPG